MICDLSIKFDVHDFKLKVFLVQRKNLSNWILGAKNLMTRIENLIIQEREDKELSVETEYLDLK